LKRVATGLVCLFCATASFAACSGTIPVADERKDSQVVIIGTVMSSRQVPQAWDSLDGVDYVVHIDQKVKGKQTGEITVFSEHSEDGFALQPGKQYLLFLTNNYQHWVVNKCGNSGPLDDERAVIKQMIRSAGND
jgi:hypothetical protein